MYHIRDEFPLQEYLYHDEPLTADIVFTQDSLKEGPVQRGVQGHDIYDEYDQCVQLMKNKRDITEFQDSKFPAQVIPSFADADQKPYIENLKRMVERKGNKSIQWKRPTEFMEGEIKLFDNIEPNDIKQQLLGDCYLLGSVSALAEIPYYIERIFINKHFQQNGLYGLNLIHNGMKKQVALDDYIPCGDNGGPIFSKNSDNELWVLLIEKAYAKIYGNYKKIISGMPGEAISDLTGAPYEFITRRPNDQQLDPVKTWEFLQKHEKAEHIITAGSFSDDRGDAHKNDKGVYAGHCYSILDNREVVGSDGQPDKIIKLRNPWGTGEWKGDWSDNSGKWTAQLKKDLQFSGADDGIFWMSLTDMVQNYSSVYANLVNRNYDYWSIKLSDQKVEKTMRAVAIQVPEKVHGYLTITFKEKRMFTESHQYGLQRLLLAKLDQTNNIIDFVGATSSFSTTIKRDQHVEVNLEPGNYLAFAEADWTQKYDRHLVVGFYGSGKVIFSEQNFDQDTYQKEISTLFRLLAQNHPNLIISQEKGQFRSLKTKQLVGGYQFSIYENRGKQNIPLDLGTKQLLLNKQESHIEKNKQTFNSKFDCVGDSISLDGNSPSPVAPKQQQGGQQSTESDESIISTIKTKVSQFQSIKVGDKNTEVKCVTIQGEVCVLFENKYAQTLKFSIKYQDPNLRGVNFDITQPVALNIDSNGCKLLRMKQNDTSKALNLNFLTVSK